MRLLRNNKKGQTLTEYVLIVAALVIGLLLVNKSIFNAVGAALERISSVISLPVP